MIFAIIPLGFSCLLLGAHFLRSAHLVLTLLCWLMPFLLLVKKRWSLIILQLFIYMGAVVWINTAVFSVIKRMKMGLPWHMPAIIMGTVALFTIFSGLLLNLKSVKEKYTLEHICNQTEKYIKNVI